MAPSASSRFTQNLNELMLLSKVKLGLYWGRAAGTGQRELWAGGGWEAEKEMLSQSLSDKFSVGCCGERKESF